MDDIIFRTFFVHLNIFILYHSNGKVPQLLRKVFKFKQILCFKSLKKMCLIRIMQSIEYIPVKYVETHLYLQSHLPRTLPKSS